jgi:hypothetical protein
MHEHDANVASPDWVIWAFGGASTGVVHSIHDDVGVRLGETVFFVDQEPDPHASEGIAHLHVVLPKIVIAENANDTEPWPRARQQVRKPARVAVVEGDIVSPKQQNVGRRLGNLIGRGGEQSGIRERTCMQVRQEDHAQWSMTFGHRERLAINAQPALKTERVRRTSDPSGTIEGLLYRVGPASQESVVPASSHLLARRCRGSGFGSDG